METIKIAGREFELNRNLLKFDEHNINRFLVEFAGYYDYYGEAHALACAQSEHFKNAKEIAYDEKYLAAKLNGKAADNVAKAQAEIDPAVQTVTEQFIQATYRVKRMQGWMRSLDKAYESAKEYCYNMRKELDKLCPTVKEVDSESL